MSRSAETNSSITPAAGAQGDGAPVVEAQLDVATLPEPGQNPLIRVLLVEDDEDDYLLTRDLLRESAGAQFELTWAATYDAGLGHLAGGAAGATSSGPSTPEPVFDVCLVDYRLGQRNGLDFIRTARQRANRESAYRERPADNMPFILLTGQSDHAIDLQALAAGAADYLNKTELSGPLLWRSIRYALERRRATNALLASQEQLRQAQKLEAVGRLAGGVAHDFNNLLTAITGYSELLLSRLSEEAIATALGAGNAAVLAHAEALRADVDEIHKAAKRGAALTKQLLTFSRKQLIQPTVLDLNAVLSDLVNLLRRMLGENINIAPDPAPDLWRVRADRGQVEQVVINLAINARDAMPAGGQLRIATANAAFDSSGGAGAGVAAWIAAAQPMPPGRYVMLSVADTGMGMDAETCSHIFEPFFTTKEPGKGTGLGLSTVYGIVQNAGGSVHVQSEIGRGSTFTVYLPAVAAGEASASDNGGAASPASTSAPAAAASAAASASLSSGKPLGSTPAATASLPAAAAAASASTHSPSAQPASASPTILLVEDQDVVRKLIGRILKSKGYNVFSAPGGESALALCRQVYENGGRIDLLLTDVMMSGMNGRELARRVVAQWPGIRVTFISGYTSGEIGDSHGTLEFDATFLQKPFTTEALIQNVRQSLGNP